MENTSAASTTFGLDLFRVVCAQTPDANGFISPFSLSVALSMTQLGAGGETSRGMMNALRWEEGKDKVIHEENKKYISMLQKPNEEYVLSVANRLFVEQSYNLMPEFLQQTKDIYLAEALPSNFKTDAENERVTINTWVSDQTRDRIKDLLAQGVLNTDTRMVLVNAVYFKGLWKEQFNAKHTLPLPFKVSASSTKNVPTMVGEMSVPFWLDWDNEEGFSALELPYKGNELSMVILLPKDDFGLADMEKNLTREKLTSIFSRLTRPDKINVQLPKFEMTCSYTLNQPLADMGMDAAFSPFHADFSKMTPTNDLYVSQVVQKAFVKVDEEGSEAAAATGVVMMTRCIMLPDEFLVDHPFVFVIKDRRASNSILFMGRVTDPSCV